jgi:hypothetical protein
MNRFLVRGVKAIAIEGSNKTTILVDKATWRELFERQPFGCRSSASPCLVTRADQRFVFDALVAGFLIATPI